MADVEDHLHLCVRDKLDMCLFCVGASVEPGVVAAGGPFGQVLHAVHCSGDFEVWSFQHRWYQADIIPQATIVGLAGKLSVVQAYEVVALVLFHTFGEGDIQSVGVWGCKIYGKQVLSKMEVSILAIVLDLETTQIAFFNHCHVVA